MAQKHKTAVTELLSMKTVQIQLFFNYPLRSYDRVLMILNNVISWFVTSLSAFLTVFPWKNASKLTPLRISNVTSVHGLERFLRSLWPHQPDETFSPLNFLAFIRKSFKHWEWTLCLYQGSLHNWIAWTSTRSRTYWIRDGHSIIDSTTDSVL